MAKVNLFSADYNAHTKLLVPYVSGVNKLFQWSQVETSEGVYDFSSVDTSLAPWIAAGKTVNLMTWATPDTVSGPIGNEATPAYIWNLLGPENYTEACNGQRMPNYLSPVWIARMKAFIKAVHDHYAGKVGYIRIGLGHGGEAIPIQGWLNTQIACGQAYARWGTTTAAWTGYIKSMLAYEASLTGVQWMVTITPGGNPISTLPDYIAGVSASLGIGFGSQGFQASDLKGCETTTANWCNLFSQYPEVQHELQTIGQTNPTGAGSVGALPALLSYGLEHGCTDFELYANDWLIAYDPSNPDYAAHHQAYAAAITDAQK
jgi:hypothetical protein